MPNAAEESLENADENADDPPETRSKRRAPAPEVARTGVFGAIPVDVTHWCAKRFGLNGAWESCSHPTPDGKMALSQWPIVDLTEDTLQERWGAGTFQLLWYKPGENGSLRYVTNSKVIKVLPVAPAAPVAPSVVVPRDGFGDVERALSMMTVLSQLSATLVRPPLESPVSDELRQITAQVAGLQAKIEADARRREIEERHRAELAERDRRIAALEREAEMADMGSGGDAPLFSPDGGSIWEQVGYGLLNAATKKPEIVAALLTPILAKLSGQPLPDQAPQPAQASAPPPRPVPIRAVAASPATAAAPIDLSANAMPSSPIVAPAPDLVLVPTAVPPSVPVVAANGAPRAPARPPAAVPGPDPLPSS